jgi:hypothetical protein
METKWVVEIGEEFEPEFFALHEDVRLEILASIHSAAPVMRT